jgi:DNA-binding beta-propeller fold protein YncE
LRKALSSFLLFAFIAAVASLFAQNQLGQDEATQTGTARINVQFRHIPLPTSKSLSGPIPGTLGSLNGFTPSIAVSPDHRYAAFLNDGYGTQRSKAHQSITILDLSTNKLTEFPDDRLAEDAHQSYFIGLAFSSDGNHLYASIGSITDPTGERFGNTGNGIAVYRFQQGTVKPERFLRIPPQRIADGKKVAYALRKTAPGNAISYPAGLAVIVQAGQPDKLLVANNYSDNAVLLDSATGHTLASFDLSTNKIIPSSFPYTCVAARDGSRAWCSLWNASRVAELDLQNAKVLRWIPLLQPSDPLAPGSHPTAMVLSPDQKLLYVALANADRAIAVPTDGRGPMFSLNTALPTQQFGGSCPSGLAVTADGTRLFVSDACINAVAVFDVSNLLRTPIRITPLFTAQGFIPTQWYPSALATVGNDLLIATSKGQGTGPNNFPGGTGYEQRHKKNAYIPTLLYGSAARVNIDDIEKRLPDLTREVEQSNLFNLDPGKLTFAQGSNPIRHVIYIIKENRTYDQILGDLKVGNGDPSLTMYGADVTPNEHKLALQFGVLDNFYDSGEVSGDGHEWSTAAIATDYNENTWQIAYRGKERTYDFQGTVADEFPLDNGESDIDAPTTGYLWDNVASHNLTYRDYGEFVAAIWCKPERVQSPKQGTPSAFSEKCAQGEVSKGEPLPSNVGQPHGSASPWPWPVPLMKSVKPTKAVLRGHFDPNFPDFNTEYPDQLRADEFLNEFDSFVRARQENKGGQLPAFVLLYLPDDHTHGTTPGKPRPAASVADNDLAVGRVVEAVSHSPYWDDTAILMLEDDAQDGADHVDAHRSIAFVISKYSPGSSQQSFLEHGFYTTVNLIHTIETLLGLPPMNQNDAYAPILARLFSGSGNQSPFTADWSNRDNGHIYEVNPPRAFGAELSKKMDFSRPDANNPALLNAILWHDQKADKPVPTPKHAVFPQP